MPCFSGISSDTGPGFLETYAPVMRLESFRSLITITATEDFEVHQMDIIGAYLNGDLNEEIYMKQPPGFEDGSQCVCRLQKALYGLKQAGRVWNKKLNHIFTIDLSLQQLNPDLCIYQIKSKSGIIYIIIHIDDMAIFASNLLLMDEIEQSIKLKLNVTNLGELKLFLGLEIECNRKRQTISLRQSGYIWTILEHFQMQDSHPVHMPMDPNVKLTPTPEDERPLDVPYAAAIRSLMYAAVATQPDILFSVQCLSQFMVRPSDEHWTAVKRVLCYLNGTWSLGLVYGGTQDTTLIGYTDANWGTNLVDQKSISGYVFLISGGAIS